MTPANVLVCYWLDHACILRRVRPTAPRIGDRVRIGGVIHCVTLVCWIEDRPDNEQGRVNIELMPETLPMPAGACFERAPIEEPPPLAPVAELPKRKRKHA
jgi:hypothetical protein